MSRKRVALNTAICDRWPRAALPPMPAGAQSRDVPDLTVIGSARPRVLPTAPGVGRVEVLVS